MKSLCVSPEYLKYVQVQKDAESLDLYIYGKKPTNRQTMMPVHPFDADPISINKNHFAKLAENIGVDRLEVKTLLAYAICDNHEDEVINAAIKKLLVLIKLRLEDNARMQHELQKVFYYERLCAETIERNDVATKQFETETAIYQKNIDDRLEDMRAKLCALVEEAFEAHQNDRKSVWQTLCIDEIRDRVGNDIAEFVDAKFANFNRTDLSSFAIRVGKRHRNWLSSQLEDVVDEIHYKLWETTPCEVDAETFLQYFDKDGNPLNDADHEYDRAMSEWDDELRWKAQTQARKIIQQRVAEQIDGYGPTYGLEEDLR